MTDLIKLVVASVVGGAVGGGIVHFVSAAPHDPLLAPDPDQAATAAPADPPAGRASGDDVGDRVRALEVRLAKLQRQMAKRSQLKDYAKQLDGTAAPVSSGDAAPERSDPEDPTFELAVRSVVDRIQFENEEKRRDERTTRRERRVSGQVEYLTEQLGLSDDQIEKLEEALMVQMEAFGALRDSDARPATRREWRERGAEIRAATRESLSGVLNETQLGQYDEIQAEEQNRRRGPR